MVASVQQRQPFCRSDHFFCQHSPSYIDKEWFGDTMSKTEKLGGIATMDLVKQGVLAEVFSIYLVWGMCKDKYSAEMHTGERPSMHDRMNKHCPLFHCNYSPRASG